jgi:threonine/homoserine/homoserine lactone efflux protein
MSLLSQQLVAFIAFTVAAAATPGPSNTLLATTGAQRGLLRGLPALVGASAGMATLMAFVMLGLGTVILEIPLLVTVMRVCGGVFLCWLAWRTATAGPHASARDRSAGFWAMAAFQWINPKAWLICAAAAATFLDPAAGSAVGQSVTLAITFAAITVPCFLPWLAFGAALQRLLSSDRAAGAFNIAMASLLAASVIFLIL